MSTNSSCWLGATATALLLGASGCTWLNGPALAVHPSVRPDSSGGGAAVGMHFPIQETAANPRTVGVLPYGEGWARFGGLGPGQLEVRVTPAMGFLGYRVPILDAPELPITLDIIPSAGLGFFFVSSPSSGGVGGSGDLRGVTFGATATALVGLMERRLYIAARGGALFTHFGIPGVLGGGSTSSDNGIMSFGLNVGYVLGFDAFDVTIELAWLRNASTATGAPIHLLAPTVGFSFAAPPAPATPPETTAPVPTPEPASPPESNPYR